MREGWEVLRFADVLELEGRKAPVAEGSRYPIVGVLGFGRGLIHREPVSSKSTSYRELNIIGPNRVIYSKLKAFEGAITVTPADLRESYASAEFPTFITTPRVLPAFFHLLTQRKELWDSLAARSKGMGGRRERLNPRDFLEIPALFPPLLHQRRIVDLIGALDVATGSCEAVVANALRAYSAQVATLQDGQCDSVRLLDIVRTARAGGTPSRKEAGLYGGTIPWVKSGEVAGSDITETEETLTDAALARSSAWLVPAGAILVAMYGATAAQVGRLAVPAATNQAVLALVPDPRRVDGDYLYHLLRSDSARIKKLATGAAQPNLSKGVITAQEYRVPPLEIQRELANRMGAILDVEERAKFLAERLREVRSNMLAILLSGGHRIPESYDELIEGVA